MRNFLQRRTAERLQGVIHYWFPRKSKDIPSQFELSRLVHECLLLLKWPLLLITSLITQPFLFDLSGKQALKLNTGGDKLDSSTYKRLARAAPGILN